MTTVHIVLALDLLIFAVLVWRYFGGNRRAFKWEEVNYFSQWTAWWAWFPVRLHHTNKRAWCRWVMRRWGVALGDTVQTSEFESNTRFDIRWQYEEPLTAMMFPEGVPTDDSTKGHAP